MPLLAAAFTDAAKHFPERKKKKKEEGVIVDYARDGLTRKMKKRKRGFLTVHLATSRQARIQRWLVVTKCVLYGRITC